MVAPSRKQTNAPRNRDDARGSGANARRARPSERTASPGGERPAHERNGASSETDPRPPRARTGRSRAGSNTRSGAGSRSTGARAGGLNRVSTGERKPTGRAAARAVPRTTLAERAAEAPTARARTGPRNSPARTGGASPRVAPLNGAPRASTANKGGSKPPRRPSRT